MAGFLPPTVAELKDWITPAEALKRATVACGGSQSVAAKAIVDKLKDGLLRAAAGVGVKKPDHGEKTTYRNVMIPGDRWSFPSISFGVEAFWTTATLDTIEGRYTNWTFHHVVIDPLELAASLPQGAREADRIIEPAPTSQAPDTRKPVPPGPLEKWAKVFTGVHGTDFTGPQAQQSAEAMFPEYSVGRDRVVKALTDLVGPRRRGAKKKTDPEIKG